MPDASHIFGSDLALGATGDLLMADGVSESQQRVLRRLLTNPKDYLWQPDYGAGLPAYIGLPLDAAAMSALIKSQMYLERDVSHAPEPVVNLSEIANGISAQIAYISLDSDAPAYLSFDVTP